MQSPIYIWDFASNYCNGLRMQMKDLDIIVMYLTML